MKNICTLEVRPYECDMNGHVNHAVYVNYLEFARMQFLRQMHFDYEGMLAAGFFVFVHRLDIRYKAQATLGDVLRIESTSAEMKRVSGMFRQQIFCGDVLVLDADVYWCVVNEKGRPARPPDPFDCRKLHDLADAQGEGATP